MIANARMYSVSAEVGVLWRRLLEAVTRHAQLPIQVIEHPAPAPLGELWERTDKAAVFMCGLPYSRTEPKPVLIAAPVPSPPDFEGQPQYWSEVVVRADSTFRTLADTFGQRVAFTTPESQSGYFALLIELQSAGSKRPLFREVIAPQTTPLGALRAVISGAAEVAPIDAYAYWLLQRYCPELTAQVRSIARTRSTPIPVLVASAPQGLEPLSAALLAAHTLPDMAPILRDLLLDRFVKPDPLAYQALCSSYSTAVRFWREHPLAVITHPAFAL
jgi:ABC-type phosphate/phosphonate transport system substrate-binding protein